jgi:hypothetical protein
MGSGERAGKRASFNGTAERNRGGLTATACVNPIHRLLLPARPDESLVVRECDAVFG